MEWSNVGKSLVWARLGLGSDETESMRLDVKPKSAPLETTDDGPVGFSGSSQRPARRCVGVASALDAAIEDDDEDEVDDVAAATTAAAAATAAAADEDDDVGVVVGVVESGASQNRLVLSDVDGWREDLLNP